jgi:hypothetical protein
MGIRDRPISARSPWQNEHAERLIGSIRRECLDRVVVFGEGHLRTLLRSYQQYYNECRTHLSLDKDAPLSRPVAAHGRIAVSPVLGGLPNIAGFEFPTETGSRLPRAVPRSHSRGVAAPRGNAHRRALEAGAQHHRPGGALSLPEHRFPPPWSPHGVARFSAGNKLPVP